jgi:hypothetical protein
LPIADCRFPIAQPNNLLLIGNWQSAIGNESRLLCR